jgi:hypothetical protein
VFSIIINIESFFKKFGKIVFKGVIISICLREVYELINCSTKYGNKKISGIKIIAIKIRHTIVAEKFLDFVFL